MVTTIPSDRRRVMSVEDDWRRGLVELAWAVGVEPEYHDIRGRLHLAGVDTLVAVLSSRGVPIDGLDDVPGAWQWWHERVAGTAVEPVVSAREGHPLGLRLRLPGGSATRKVKATLQCEDGTDLDLGVVSPGLAERCLHGTIQTDECWIELDQPRPVGYHRLHLEVGDQVLTTAVIAAPVGVCTFPAGARAWGAFAPLYALRERADVTSFDRLGAWLASIGGSVLGTLPLLATFLGTEQEPYAPSPYTPVSRRFFNEMYLDLERLGRVRLDAEARAALTALGRPGPFDHRGHASLVHRVLADTPWTPSGEVPVPDLDRYASFRAMAARQGTGWRDWPPAARSGVLVPGDFDPDLQRLHLLAQHLIREQLGGLARAMSDRGQRLYLDLPIGAHPDGFDTWHDPGLFAARVATGAPPDDFFTGGQNWGFPPIDPGAGREQVHRHFRECLSTHMEIAGILRLDHIMGLHRLYWVPEGMDATEGAYVRYPRDELFGVLAIESQRHDCIVVGEDLGTVPDEVREAMAQNRVLGMYVSEFSLPTWQGAPPIEPTELDLATIDTHDTPTFVGFCNGLDIAQRVATAQLDENQARHELADRGRQVDSLRRHLVERDLLGDDGEDPAMLVALVRSLGTSDSPCVLVALEDLWGEGQPQNIPGTPVDRPNWVQRFPFTIDELTAQPAVTSTLEALDLARKEPRP